MPHSGCLAGSRSDPDEPRGGAVELHITSPRDSVLCAAGRAPAHAQLSCARHLPVHAPAVAAAAVCRMFAAAPGLY